ncbi:MAG TPA: thioesterase family protein [Minicystis sp.]|nr:thioesterase family protein [Minicystis sp.]
MDVPHRHVSRQRVYFDDLDALNILHNMRYILFIERARGELFNQLGFRWDDDVAHNPDKFCVIAEHHIRYLAPVRGECELVVETRIPRIGRTSLLADARVLAADGTTPHAEGQTRLVRLHPETFRPTPWSDRFRAAIEAFAAITSSS